MKSTSLLVLTSPKCCDSCEFEHCCDAIFEGRVRVCDAFFCGVKYDCDVVTDVCSDVNLVNSVRLCIAINNCFARTLRNVVLE